MILLNPRGREVQVNSKVLEKIRKRGDTDKYQRMPAKTICDGPEKHICLLLGNNGIGDDIHAMPAIAQKIAEGFTIDVYSRPFTKSCYELLGATFYDYGTARIGFMEKHKKTYDAVYHLSQWCMSHEQETDGKPTKTRFEQFAGYIETSLPDRFNWQSVFGMGYNPFTPPLLALHATSPHRSYPLVASLYKLLRQQEMPFAAMGNSPDEIKFSSFADMLQAISLARVVVTVDTGPLAIALALQVPVVALFGGSDVDIIVNQFKKYNTDSAYWKDSVKIITDSEQTGCSFPCNWHHKNGFQVKGKCKSLSDCMLSITPQRVIGAMQGITRIKL